MNKNFSKRHKAESRFKAYGFFSLIAAAMLAIIIGSMIYRSIPAYTNYTIDLEINMTEISLEDGIDDINYRGILIFFFSFFPVQSRSDKRKLFKLISSSNLYSEILLENLHR